MYGELYQYLVLHKRLSLPGIGTFQVERKPADIDFANKVVNPPSYSIALHHGVTGPSRKLFDWLSRAFDIPEREAISRFNDFAFDIKEQVMSGRRLEWSGVGVLSKGLAGEIRFEPSVSDWTLGTPVPAVKVIREKAEHTIRVGESQKTSTEMLELLNPAASRRSYAWVVALVLLILSFIFIAWYFSQQGLDPSVSGNRQNVNAPNQPATHKDLP